MRDKVLIDKDLLWRLRELAELQWGGQSGEASRQQRIDLEEVNRLVREEGRVETVRWFSPVERKPDVTGWFLYYLNEDTRPKLSWFNPALQDEWPWGGVQRWAYVQKGA